MEICKFWPSWVGLRTANDTRSYYAVLKCRVGRAGSDACVEYKGGFSARGGRWTIGQCLVQTKYAKLK